MFKGICPRCKTSSMFKGLLSFHEACPTCSLPLAERDVGDGATFIVVILVGFLITLGSVIVEFSYSPPLWVHAVLWLPLTLLLSIAGLRVARAVSVRILYAQELRHSAKEYRP
jgi:uncharacterized protein (DUF983 family)